MSASASSFPVVVHCHLRWTYGWQRPKQIHTRLAARHPVLYIEEAIEVPESSPRMLLTSPFPNVTVAQPQVPAGESARVREMRTLELLSELAAGPLGATFQGAVHWLYTPAMEPQVHFFRSPAVLVYECLDDLAGPSAPEGLLQREDSLLRRAAVVFTGGHQLHLAKSRRHANVHLFGSGVDFDHFRSSATREVAADLAALPAPRLGYLGVIDEKLDYRLLDELARSSGATVALVGPIARVNPSSLPQRENLFYLGPKAYADLPSYLAGFDLCLMPFVVQESTRFLNPGKTLEYLASGRQVLSTPIPEVVRSYGEVVHVATRETFSARAREILSGDRFPEGPGLDIARRSSWEETVASMETLVERALASRRPSDPRLALTPGRERGEKQVTA